MLFAFSFAHGFSALLTVGFGVVLVFAMMVLATGLLLLIGFISDWIDDAIGIDVEVQKLIAIICFIIIVIFVVAGSQ